MVDWDETVEDTGMDNMVGSGGNSGNRPRSWKFWLCKNLREKETSQQICATVMTAAVLTLRATHFLHKQTV